MKIIINHQEEEIATQIMWWLWDNANVRGTEDHLKDELLIDLLSPSEIWDLEAHIEDVFGEYIELNKNLKFIEV